MAKTYYASWEESNGEYWYDETIEVQACDVQEATRLVVANGMMGREIVEIRNFLVREKEVQNAR